MKPVVRGECGNKVQVLALSKLRRYLIVLLYVFAMRAGTARPAVVHCVSLEGRKADAVDGHAHQLTMTIVSLRADSRCADQEEQYHQQRQKSSHFNCKNSVF